MIAVLKRRLHKEINRHDLREGSYIVLKEYRLATAPRLNGVGNIQYVMNTLSQEAIAYQLVRRYIAILDFYVIGEERRYESTNADSQSTSTPDQQARATSVLIDERQHKRGPEQSDIIRSHNSGLASGNDAIRALSKSDGSDTEKADAFERQSIGTLPSLQTQTASNSDNAENMFQSQVIGTKRKRTVIASTTEPENDPEMRSPSRKSQNQNQFDYTVDENLRAAVSRQTESPWARKAKAAGTPLQPIERPLRLYTLASVTGVNRSRNKVVDILAMVDSVDDSTVKPAHLPLKRDIRIIDGSTDVPITISIFVDPVDCIPSVGDVVLFRNLVTHDWKQGALNAYPKYCDGKDWYIPDLEGVEGWGRELKDLKAKILATEQERRRSVNVGATT